MASSGQDNLLDVLEAETKDSSYRELIQGTFKSTRLINGHSVEMSGKGEALFIIAHRFGAINGGAYELFGLDQSAIRFGLEYNPMDNLTFGWGRSSWRKTYDGFAKWKILQQAKGFKAMPISLVYLTSFSLESLKWLEPARDNLFSSRLSYSHQLLIARKFSPRISLQVMPGLVHYNLVPEKDDRNDILYAGVGGRFLVIKRMAITAEYYQILTASSRVPHFDGMKPQPVLALGIDVETGGHVFQLQATNTQSVLNEGFISRTTGDWLSSDIYLGFNITRVFPSRKHK